MQTDEKQKFLTLLAGVHNFYGKELSEFSGQVWWEASKDYEYGQVSKALSSHLRDPDKGAFMPKPSDLVRQLQGTYADRSLVAWGKVMEAMQRAGAYASVAFDDGAIHAAIEDLGGWVLLCRTTNDELSYTQKRFCDSYRIYSKRPDATYPSRLLGIAEASNAIRGYQTPGGPALIGDPNKAREVLVNGSNQPRTQISRLVDSLPELKRINAGNQA
jgi:hypothetical protein